LGVGARATKASYTAQSISSGKGEIYDRCLQHEHSTGASAGAASNSVDAWGVFTPGTIPAIGDNLSGTEDLNPASLDDRQTSTASGTSTFVIGSNRVRGRRKLNPLDHANTFSTGAAPSTWGRSRELTSNDAMGRVDFRSEEIIERICISKNRLSRLAALRRMEPWECAEGLDVSILSGQRNEACVQRMFVIARHDPLVGAQSTASAAAKVRGSESSTPIFPVEGVVVGVAAGRSPSTGSGTSRCADLRKERVEGENWVGVVAREIERASDLDKSGA
jgi:hypothetical protein